MIAGIDFELVRVLLAVGMLGIAAFLDIRKREVSDLLWIVFGMAALAVYAVEFAYDGTFELFATAIPILFASAIAFGIYKSGLFGGADALALITLAVVMPTFSGGIAGMVTPLGNTFLLHPIVPLVVLSNAVILSLSQIGFNLISNALYALKNHGKLFEGLEHESMGRKVTAIAIGHRAGSRTKYAFSIEQTVGGRREFSFAPRNAEKSEYESHQNVWVTGGTPLLVFMLAGFLVMIFLGDLIALMFAGIGWI